MPVAIWLRPLPSSDHSTSMRVSRVDRSTRPVRSPVAAGAGAARPSASSTWSFWRGEPIVIRRQVGSASNVRTTIPALSRREIHGSIGSPRSANRQFADDGEICQPRPDNASRIRSRSATVSATSASIRPRSSVSARTARASEKLEMLPGGRIASSLRAIAGGASR